MKPCESCGWENEDQAACCSNCSRALKEGEIGLENFPSFEPPRPQLRAGTATIIFLVYLGIQVVGGFITALCVMAFNAYQGKVSTDQNELMQQIVPPSAFFSLIVGG